MPVGFQKGVQDEDPWTAHRLVQGAAFAGLHGPYRRQDLEILFFNPPGHEKTNPETTDSLSDDGLPEEEVDDRLELPQNSVTLVGTAPVSSKLACCAVKWIVLGRDSLIIITIVFRFLTHTGVCKT